MKLKKLVLFLSYFVMFTGTRHLSEIYMHSLLKQNLLRLGVTRTKLFKMSLGIRKVAEEFSAQPTKVLQNRMDKRLYSLQGVSFLIHCHSNIHLAYISDDEISFTEDGHVLMTLPYPNSSI